MFNSKKYFVFSTSAIKHGHHVSTCEELRSDRLGRPEGMSRVDGPHFFFHVYPCIHSSVIDIDKHILIRISLLP